MLGLGLRLGFFILYIFLLIYSSIHLIKLKFSTFTFELEIIKCESI